MKMMSILCLMMILRGGFANPVAGEGGSNEGLGFMAAIADFGNPLLSFFANDAIKDGQVNTIERGKMYKAESVHKLAFKYNVQNENMCCEECQKTHPDTEFFSQSYRSFPKHASIRDCTCMKPKPGYTPQTYDLGQESGQCGIWTYNGDGDLGFGRYISGGVGILGLVLDVNSAAQCCESCMATDKFPATHLFEFSLKEKRCKCYKTIIGKAPVTSAKDYAIGTCPAIEVTDAPPVTDAPKVTDAPPAVTDALNVTSEVEVSEPAVSVEQHSQSDASPGTEDDLFSVIGGIIEAVASAEQHSESDASQGAEEDSGNQPDAAALTIPEKPGCQSRNGIACCPQFTPGDNAGLGKETFVQEYELVDGDCQKTCQDDDKFPNSVGMTQHLHQKYSNGKPKCWCESGEPALNANAQNYHTCLF